MSGERGGHGIGPSLPIHRSGKVSLRNSRLQLLFVLECRLAEVPEAFPLCKHTILNFLCRTLCTVERGSSNCLAAVNFTGER